MNIQEKHDLVWAMKSSLLEQIGENRVITESKETSIKMSKFIKEEITYEQLLNLCFNPNQKTKYLSENVLEEGLKDIIKKMRAGAIRISDKYPKLTATGIFLFPSEKLIGKYTGYLQLGIFATYIYKRWFSMKAKACSNVPNDQRRECVIKVENGGIVKAIEMIKKNKLLCSKTKNPSECERKINTILIKWNKKLKKNENNR